MAAKISKEELASILKRILKQSDMDDLRTEIDDIADEYRIDLSEPDEDEIEEERDAYLEEDEVEDIVNGWEEEDEDY